MPRFFFDLENGLVAFIDPEGTDLPDLDAARREAADTLLRSAHDQLRDAQDRGEMAISVRDEQGRRRLKLTLTLLISE